MLQRKLGIAEQRGAEKANEAKTAENMKRENIGRLLRGQTAWNDPTTNGAL